jgi:hypothetical protein
MVGEYTSLEWLQMGMFLIGMPIAALLGSLTGLFGKWNQGRVITAAIVGLGCAALVAVVLFLTFFAVHAQTPAGQPSFLLELFDGFFATRIAYLAIIATGAISILAAIGMRSRGDEAGGRIVRISMRQLLLLQLFPFIALACWVGARSYALESGGDLLRAQRLWSQREWEVSSDESKLPSGWMREFGRPGLDMAKESEYFKEILHHPTLKSLEFRDLGNPDLLVTSELARAKSLNQIIAYHAGSPDLDENLIRSLGSVKSLKFLVLGTGGKLLSNLQPLAALPHFDTFILSDCTASPEALNELAQSKSLRRLYLVRITNSGPTRPLHFPSTLDTFILGNRVLMQRWNLEHLDEAKALRSLHIRHQKLTSVEVKAIAACAALEELELDEAIEEPDLEELLALNKLRVLTITEAGAKRSLEFRAKLEKVAMLSSLVQLNCDHQLVIELDEWSGAKPMPEIEERESRHDKWMRQVNDRREELGLPMIKITFTQNVGPFMIAGGVGSAQSTGEATPAMGAAPPGP